MTDFAPYHLYAARKLRQVQAHHGLRLGVFMNCRLAQPVAKADYPPLTVLPIDRREFDHAADPMRKGTRGVYRHRTKQRDVERPIDPSAFFSFRD